MIKNIIKISILILFNTFFSCFSPEKKQQNDMKNTDYDWLIGKAINSVDSIVDKEKKGSFIIYIFNYHDCGDCVNAGFYISKKIDSLSETQVVVYPIASMISNPSAYQRENEYYEYIPTDDRDLIRRELKYLPTPVLLLMDSNKVILNVFFPKDTLMKNHQSFVEFCLRTCNNKD
jgi:hypothetical protein